jgi:hypothetical protein
VKRIRQKGGIFGTPPSGKVSNTASAQSMDLPDVLPVAAG